MKAVFPQAKGENPEMALEGLWIADIAFCALMKAAASTTSRSFGDTIILLNFASFIKSSLQAHKKTLSVRSIKLFSLVTVCYVGNVDNILLKNSISGFRKKKEVRQQAGNLRHQRRQGGSCKGQGLFAVGSSHAATSQG